MWAYRQGSFSGALRLNCTDTRWILRVSSMGQTGLLPGPRAAPTVPVYCSFLPRCVRRLPAEKAVCKWTGSVLAGQQNESRLLLIRHAAPQWERPVHPPAQRCLAPDIDSPAPQGCQLWDIREAARALFCCKVVSWSFTKERFFGDVLGGFETMLIFAAVFWGEKSLAGLGFVEYKWPLINF